MNRPDAQLPADDIEIAASTWLARRDRGFSGAEQDGYLQWLQENPAHAAAVARIEKSWGALDQLSEWRPAHSSRPNPDLLAPRSPSRPRWFLSGMLATAAAVVFAFFVSRPTPAPQPAAPVARLVQNSEIRKLADGSIVEVNRDSQIDVDYTDTERRVRLVRGEAHFTVMKNPGRPFIVDAGGIAVRAIGTAFNVRMADGAVEVLVTSGKVQVDSVEVSPDAPAFHTPLAPSVEEGHRVVVDEKPEPTAAAPAVEAVAPRDMERALAWQGLRVEFAEATLAQAVAEFNRHNRHQLVIADPKLASVKIGGTFRADNVDGFVRLMVGTFGIAADRVGDDQTVLRAAP